jgi:hypothetical protein
MPKHQRRLAYGGLLAAAVLVSIAFAGGQARQVVRRAKPALKPRPVSNEAARRPFKAAPFVPALAGARVVLDISQGGGEFQSWVTALPLDVPMPVWFRWKSDNPEAKSARWEVSTSPFPPAYAPYAWTPSIIARGAAGQAAASGTFHTFSIDFRKFLPTPPPASPIRYYVRVVATAGVSPIQATAFSAGRGGVTAGGASGGGATAQPAAAAAAQPSASQGVSSSPVIVTYAKPGTSQTVFDDLPPSPYEVDADLDGLPDLAEFQIAEKFKPYFVFDSDEGNRRPNEPVVVFQVRPDGCIGLKCPGAVRAQIKFYLLFAEDGGYGPSSDCTDSHNGDNQTIDMTVESADREPYGSAWRLTHINNGGTFQWPGWGVRFWADVLRRETHPVIYMSAHKHHQYFDTNNDGKDSTYSSYGCNDDVNGGGAIVFANLLTPQARPANAGEPEAHPAAYFVNDLTPLGFRNECAWCGKDFKGGLGDDGGETSQLEWFNHGFHIMK